MSQQKKVFKWTIARKIGGLATLLISFNLIIMIYSILSLRRIKKELNEIASLDIPLTELANNIEIYRLQQDTLFYRLLQNGQSNNLQGSTLDRKNTIKQLLLTKQTEVDRSLNKAIALSQRGVKITSEKLFTEIYQILLVVRQETESLNSQRTQVIQGFETKDLNKTIDEQIFEQEKYFEVQRVTLIEIINQLTARKLKLTQKHQSVFLTANTALIIAAVLLGGLLASIITIEIKNNIARLSRKVANVTYAIEEHKNLPSGHIEIKSTDEFVDLAHKLTRMIDSVSLTIEQQKQLAKHFRTLATSDPLTGAFNRLKWEENLTLEIARTFRIEEALSIIIFDVDFFKNINDSYGHDLGDRVLVEIVGIVKNQIRNIDSLYRIGGEEFAILAPATNHDQIMKLAQRVRQSIENHSFEQIDRVTISLGATQFKKSDTQKQFVNRADLALYKSKRQGRNQVQFE